MGYYTLKQLRGTEETELLVFEPEQDYLRHNGVEGFWGSVESSIDWCERNYHWSHYIAEFYNTLSNVFLLGFGLWGVYQCVKQKFELRFITVFLGIAVIGVGSALFHGGLTHVGQQGDETPMIWTIFSWLYCLICMEPKFEAQHPTLARFLGIFFVIVCLAWAVVHYYVSFVIVFQSFFGFVTTFALIFLAREYRKCDNPKARVLCRLYVQLLFSAFFVWNLDQYFCETLHSLPYGLPNPQFHAWWHVAVGFSCYCGPTFLVYQRQVALGKTVKVQYIAGLLPYVETRPEVLEKHL